MRRSVAVVIVVALVALVGPARANPLPPAQQAHVEELLLHRAFPGPTADSPLACAWGGATCTPGSTHLTFAASTTVPTLAACQGTGQTIQTCYQAAVTRLQDALSAGDVITLFEAAYRTQDVIARAQAAGATAPAWLKLAAPANLLWNFFTTHGMPLAQTGSCRTGTTDAKYVCLGALARTVYRGALDALDEHNATLVRNGRLTNARNRALAIFRAGTAPMTIGMVNARQFNPTLGASASYVHELGKYFFLREYEGLITGATPDAEVTHLNSLRGYKAASQSAGPTAYMLISAARFAGSKWDEANKRPLVLDADISEDGAEIVRLAGWTRALAGVRGQGAVMTANDKLAQALAGPASLNNLEQLSDSGYWLTWNDALEDKALTQAGEWGETCGWVTLDPIYEWAWVEGTEEEWYWDDECLNQVMQDCIAAGKTTSDECYHQHEDECYLSRTVDTLRWRQTKNVIGHDIVVDSISDGYRDLLDSNDKPVYDLDGDKIAELNYQGSAPATIAKAGVRAGNATDGCLGELGALGGQYSTTFKIVGDGANTDNDAGADEDLTSTFGSSQSGWDFVPYPVAARICPAFTAEVVGVTENKFSTQSLMAVSKAGGSTTPITFATACTTPWDYTNRVADFLGSPDLQQLRSVVSSDLPDGETFQGLIMDFANEALLLSMPAAGAFEQRADLAYVAGDVPTGATGASADTWYGDHVGLDNLDAALLTTATPLVRGLNLVEEFGQIVTGEPGATGAQAIPELSSAAFASCGSGACVDNSNAHVRALFYKRIRDALDLYQRNVRGRFEVLWRRLDGQLTDECLATTDSDGDGYAETTTCDTGASACADVCANHDAAVALVGKVDAETAQVDTMLAAQAPHLSAGDLTDYVADLSMYTASIRDELHNHLAQLEVGVDWLGQRAGRWVPNIEVDAETDVDVLLGTLDAASSELGYDDFVDGYLLNLAKTEDLANNEVSQAGAAYTNLTSYCSDGNEIDATGCGMTSTPSPTADGQVEAVNRALRDKVCKATVTLYYPHNGGVAPVEDTIDMTAPRYARYLSQMQGMGFVDGCPQFSSPSFADLATNQGSVAVSLAEVQRRLVDVQLAIDAFAQQLEQMSADSLAAAQLGVTLEDHQSQHERMEQTVDAILCAVAVVGSGMLCAGFSVASLGADAVPCVPAVAGAANACASVADDGFFGQQVTEEDLQAAYYQYTVSIQQDAGKAQVAAALDAFAAATYDYGDAFLAYLTERGAFARALAVTNQTMAGIYRDAATDPTAWFFQDQAFASMVATFHDYAEDVRQVEQLVQYSTGHALPEGLALPIGSTTYCLPRLADITVLKTYGANFGSARSGLAASSCDAITDVSDLNLVAAASVYARLIDKFDDVYGTRGSQPAWLVGSISAMPDDASDDNRELNPGEWAMLGDSPFFDPSVYVDPDPDSDPVRCPAGQIDLSDWCTTFAGGTTPVEDDTCLDPIADLSDAQRLSLAYLDHMIRGEGVSTFACTRTDVDLDGTYEYSIAAAVPTYFTYAQLGGTPTWFANANVNESWHEDQPHSITEGYYGAQTATVRRIYDRLFDEAASATGMSVQAINRSPGTFLFLLDMTPPGSTDAESSALFDPELDLLTEDKGQTQTMAEHMVSMAALCADPWACADPGAHQVDLVEFGDGWLGDRYQRPSGRQERVRYRMNTHVFNLGTDWAAKVDDAGTDPQIDAILDDPNVQRQFARRPVHTNGILLAVAGVANPDGGLYGDDTTTQPAQWALYYGVDATPRLRIKIKYSFFGTTADTGSSFANIADMLPCVAADTQLISTTTTQTCTLVSPY